MASFDNLISSAWASLTLPIAFLSSPWQLPLTLIAAISIWILASFVVLPKLHNYPPAVPALPILGNLLQLKDKKPFKTFNEWADTYGPIFTVKLGAQTVVIVNSSAIAKEAMVTKYASMSRKKLPTAVQIITSQKTMVATSDYGEEHRMLKRLLVTNLLGPIPQKANRCWRERLYSQIINDVYATASFAKKKGIEVDVNIRECLKRTLLPFAMHEVIGREVERVLVEEWGRNVQREEMLKAMVLDPMESAIKVDWRNYFPYLRWLPNRALEDQIKAVRSNADAIVRALIREQKLLLANGKKPDCYLDVLLTDATHLTERQLVMCVWEPIIEGAETTLVAVEWAMFEVARRPAVQEKLLEEIHDVGAGSRPVSEEDLPNLHYLKAVVKETLRVHSPAPLLPARHVDENIQLGGYNIRKGWEIVTNIYGINRSKETWGSNPEEWDPERFLGDEELDMGFMDHRMLTFGTGKRMCAGVAQAVAVMSMILALMVQHFQWSLTANSKEEEQANVTEVDMEMLHSHRLQPVRAIAIPRFPSPTAAAGASSSS